MSSTYAVSSAGSASGGWEAQAAAATVGPNETLSDVAQRLGVSPEALHAANPHVLHPDMVRTGQVLNTPQKAPGVRFQSGPLELHPGLTPQPEAAPAQPPAQGAASSARHEYVVQSGDTLAGIGRKLGLDWRTLAQINGVSDPSKLAAGRTLKLDGAAAAAPPAASKAEGAGVSSKAAAAPASAGDVPGKTSVAAARYAQAHALPRSKGACYAYVKTALKQSGAVSSYLPGVPAKGAGPQLERNGFHNILNDPAHKISSPYDAPVGSVLVYGAAPGATDKNAKYGHIEIRTATGFASDYASPRARTGSPANGLEGRGRVLIGVYVKPDAGAAKAPEGSSTAAPGTAAYSAANLNLGVNSTYADDISAAAQRYGLSPQGLASLVNAEAAPGRDGAWNPRSTNGTTTATGLTQFTDATWLSQAKLAGSYVNTEAKTAGLIDDKGNIAPGHEQDVLDMRLDPRKSINAAADYARTNLDALQRAGVLPAAMDEGLTAQAAYIAHHEGPAGAVRMLQGDTSHVTEGKFAGNVTRAETRQRYLDQAGGDRGQAYKAWLNDYIDTRIDPRRFMTDTTGVTAPRIETLER